MRRAKIFQLYGQQWICKDEIITGAFTRLHLSDNALESNHWEDVCEFNW